MNNQPIKNETIDLRAFSKDILIYSFGQAAILLFGVIQSLIIPKYLSTPDYGYWQLFLLCSTYVGLLHFGFLSGLLVRWAGKDINEFAEEIPIAFKGIILEQVLVVFILLPIALTANFLPAEIALAVLANAVLLNILMFLIVIVQSIKQFKIITKRSILQGFLFLLFVLIIISCGYQGYIPLIFASLITNFLILLLFIFQFRHTLFHRNSWGISLYKYMKENIEIGIFVLLGNFMLLLFLTIDQLTVGSFFTISQFAVYALAINLCGFVMVFLQAVSQVLFPYLSGSNQETRTKAYSLIRPAIVIFWAGILAIYFPFSVWIRYYLPSYAESLPLMAILLSTVGFSGLIQILHANFFKVYRKQREYFLLAGISLIGAVGLNLLTVKIFGTLTAVAATVIINISFWYLLNEMALRHLVATPIKEIIRWFLVIGAYIGAFLGVYALAEPWVLGLSLYLVLFIGVTAIGLRREMEQLWSVFRGLIKRKDNV